jgi:hypothetical protein
MVMPLPIEKFRTRLLLMKPPVHFDMSPAAVKTGGIALDFTVLELPNGKWLILPWDKRVKGNPTMFAENSIGLTLNKRHDYRGFIEAWDLFGTK